AITLMTVYNISLTTKDLPEKFSIMVYLTENVSQQDVESIMKAARKDAAVDKVKYIPKDEAWKELKANLKNTDYVLEGVGENPLPDTVEIKLKSAAMNPDTVRKLTSSLRSVKGVNEIEYGEKFLTSIYSLGKGVRTIGMVLIILMSAGTLFVCYSTVKILFYRKNREIETYRLLGATRGFIRAPFVIEGAVIGLSGGFLSLVGLLALYYFVLLKVALAFPIFKSFVFPLNLSYALPGAGLFLGITGAVFAIGRIRY
ncbi:MAG TPA: permease-like cell division protein FtsX, partial [Thermodesulfovibrionales bacterium]|nr:permease-like cell division protein FtsX [Thermodesulfovibrionales bacterium]